MLHRFSFAAMGSDCSLQLYADDAAQAEYIARAGVAEVLRLEARYSRYRPDSDLAAINRVGAEGGCIAVDGETAGLLDYAFAAYRTSGGLFDVSAGLLRQAWDFKSGRLPDQRTIDELLPRVGLDKITWNSPQLRFDASGMELDFGGLGKEYAADRAAEVCLEHGAVYGVVDLGGDIRVIGPHPDGQPWRIGVRDPRQPGATLAVANVERGALATSGDYERCIEIEGQRYSHLLDPRTGWPVQGLCSVTALADRCLVAGSVSTIAMLKGTDGIDWLQSLGVDHCWMDETGCQGSNACPAMRELASERGAPAAVK